MCDFELTMELCHQMTEAAAKAQKDLGVCISMAIADPHGALRYFCRFGDAILPSVEISQNKAYTAAVLGQSTREFGKIAQAGGEAFGINVTFPKLVIFGGGFPLKVDGKTVGGLGISGGSVEEDEAVAARVLEVFQGRQR
ncbi:MAG: heme-binding protein [Peptococcaceae bacterium]|nr:heme-binding protein [Peptococcaceae bacterium]